MRKRHIANARLTEGVSYAFTIMKTIVLDENIQDAWFVLRDPMGYKMLMPAWYYTSYNFEAGQTIQCRVDRINCHGRMFLEPQHPHYVEGQVYQFAVVDAERRIEVSGTESYFLHVMDVLGNSWAVKTSNQAWMDKPPDSIDCRLDKIKKGKLYLLPVSDPDAIPSMTPGETVMLTVSGTAPDPDDGQSCFVLQLAGNYTFLLKKKHYAKYGFKTGMQIACSVHMPDKGLMPRLEPTHPMYAVGHTYSFDVAWFEQQIYADGYIQHVMVLYDCFGEEVKIHITDDEVLRYKDRKLIQARVLGIVKSRPELELLEPNG